MSHGPSQQWMRTWSGNGTEIHSFACQDSDGGGGATTAAAQVRTRMVAVGQPTAAAQVRNRSSVMGANGKVETGQPVAANPPRFFIGDVPQGKPMKVHVFNRFQALEEKDTPELSKARKLETPMPAPHTVYKHGLTRMPMSRKKRVFTKFNACKCCPMKPIKEEENEDNEEMIGRVMEERSPNEDNEAEMVGEVEKKREGSSA